MLWADAWMTVADGCRDRRCRSRRVAVGRRIASVYRRCRRSGPVRPVYPYPRHRLGLAVLGLGPALLTSCYRGVSVALLSEQPLTVPTAGTGAGRRPSPGRGGGGFRVGPLRRWPGCGSPRARARPLVGAVRVRHLRHHGGRGHRSSPPWSSVQQLAGACIPAGPLRVELDLRVTARPDPVSFTPPQFQSLLRRDRAVAAWTTVQFFTLDVDGQASHRCSSRPAHRFPRRCCRGTRYSAPIRW